MVETDIAVLREAAWPLSGAEADHDRLLGEIGDARFVLLGEATHGSHEFYRERARLTRRLIEERGFDSVAVEADWPDAYRVNRYVRGSGDDQDAGEALGDFRRFPRWMWRNRDVAAFVAWLRDRNRRGDRKVGFYGLDLYSLHASIDAVLRYLDRVDPDAAARARQRYACFEAFGGDAQAYGHAAATGREEPCEDEAVEQLLELQRRTAEVASRDGRVEEDAAFYAEQNARLVRNAEEYYRAMFRGTVTSWNLRDTHMADTLDALAGHLGREGAAAKIVVWEHNSHVGDARATQLGEYGEVNLGQLTRERHPGRTFLVGFTTYSGTVAAASDWDTPPQRKRILPALNGSYEALLHAIGAPAFTLPLHAAGVTGVLAGPRLERAIGVIYRPETERQSHYFHCRLPEQFDALIHIDVTQAVQPLDPEGSQEEPPRTYPTGM